MPRIIAVRSSKIGQQAHITDTTNESITSANPYEVLDFLNEEFEDTLLVTWDLEKFLVPIFNILPSDVTDKIKDGGKVIWGDYKLFYGIGKGKVFSITKKERTRVKGNIYNETIYENNIYELKTFFPNDEKPKDVKETARYLIDILYTMGIKVDSKLLSPANLLQKNVLSHMSIPTIFNLDDSGLECAWCCEHNIFEWTHKYKQQHSNEYYMYDITSAYPYEISKLPNLFYAKYYPIKSSIPDDVYWGIVKANVKIKAKVHPFLPDQQYYTTEEIQRISKYNLGSAEVINGWYFKLDKEYMLFEYIMKRLYEYRYMNPLKNYLAKIMANSVQGKFLQKNGNNFGNLYNPIYASMIMSRTRLKNCDFIYNNNIQNDVIEVHVDSISSLKSTNTGSERKFGQWRKI